MNRLFHVDFWECLTFKCFASLYFKALLCFALVNKWQTPGTGIGYCVELRQTKLNINHSNEHWQVNSVTAVSPAALNKRAIVKWSKMGDLFL